MFEDYNENKIHKSLIWRYFMYNFRLGVSVVFTVTLFFVSIAFASETYDVLYLLVFALPPFVVVTLYYLERLVFLQRERNNFVYERVTLGKAKRRGTNYYFEVQAISQLGRIAKTTRSIFNGLPNHYLSINNFVEKEVVIIHLEHKKRIYVLNIIDRNL